MLTTIQDSGRFEHQHIGVPVSGAMDYLALRLGNLVLMNDEKEAALECTMIGPTIRFDQRQLICITGADLSPAINGNSVTLWKPLLVEKGETLSFGKRINGARCYICFYGGLQIPKVLGSQSTYIAGQFGGLEGRALQENDFISFRSPYQSGLKQPNWRLSNFFYPSLNLKTIRVLAGPHIKDFESLSIVQFFSNQFTISNDSNRIGYRLETTEPLELKIKKDILSSAVNFGSIQVTPQGSPIILMADRGTTGGYPIIAQVISIDLPLLAQCMPGEQILFELITLDDAQHLYIKQVQELRRLKKAIAFKYDE